MNDDRNGYNHTACIFIFLALHRAAKRWGRRLHKATAAENEKTKHEAGIDADEKETKMKTTVEALQNLRDKIAELEWAIADTPEFRKASHLLCWMASRLLLWPICAECSEPTFTSHSSLCEYHARIAIEQKMKKDLNDLICKRINNAINESTIKELFEKRYGIKLEDVKVDKKGKGFMATFPYSIKTVRVTGTIKT